MVRVANLDVNGTAMPPARHTPMYKEAKRAPGLQTPTDKRPVTHVVCGIREIRSSKKDKKRARFVPTDIPLCRESQPLTTTQGKRACMCQARAAGWSKVKMRGSSPGGKRNSCTWGTRQGWFSAGGRSSKTNIHMCMGDFATTRVFRERRGG